MPPFPSRTFASRAFPSRTFPGRIWRIALCTLALWAIGPGASDVAMAYLLPAATRLGPAPGMSMSIAGAGISCRTAIQVTEHSAGRAGAAVPAGLMAAIARVESGRADAAGQVAPWPWTVNAEGVGHYYDSKAAALAAVRQMQASGIRSIDVGCMQINLMHHPTAFASLEQAFDPVANTAYARTFLSQLFAQYGIWAKATAAYHSTTPDLGDAYARKVAAVLPDELGHPTSLGAVPSFGTVPSPGTMPGRGTLPMAARMADAGGGGLGARTALSQAGRPGSLSIPAFGRSLTTYRAAPVPLAFRPLPRRAPG
jgi:hypothetical protein